MAEGLFRDMTKGRKDINVQSAGIGAVNGQSPSTHAVEVMEELNIDISNLRSKPVTAELIKKADYIFCMTYGHLDSMLLLFPQAADKTYLVREFQTDVPVIAREVADPIGGSREHYRACRDQISESLPQLLDVVLMSKKEMPVLKTTKKIFLGADHGGIELKENVRDWLKQQELPFEDVGAFTTQSVDYPDYAGKVAYAVARGEADFGILICKTGIGMSIAANKVPGVRAALVNDPEVAKITREHNNTNVLCLAARDLKTPLALEIIETWLSTPFSGGRHERRVQKAEALAFGCDFSGDTVGAPSLAQVDPKIASIIQREEKRQRQNIELIASENFTSRAVMETQGSCLTNKYAEGYPGKRWYGGCEIVDEAEQLAIDRAKELFGADHANVQPHSGSQANMAVYFSQIKPGDKILTMDLAHGGHLTHGHKMNFSGRLYDVVHYGVTQEQEVIDYDALARQAEEHKPKLITVGASAYSRIIDFKRMREIADQVGSLLMVDMAHIAGLVAAGVHPSPVPFADFVTTTTHKTLRGPRGGLILCRAQYAKEVDSHLFPGIQGGPLMHVIAAKAVCFGEALQPEFKEYQQHVVQNAKALCEGMKKNGYRIVSGATENHLMLVDLRLQKMNGKEAQEALDLAGITVNKNSIPFDTAPPLKPSGIRLGTPAVTTRGMRTDEMFDIANLIHEALSHRTDEAKLKAVEAKVQEMTSRFTLPY